MLDKYDVTIGLEVHCEVNTTSKMFSDSPNNYNEIPNSNINEIDLAFPGILPIVNYEGVRKSIMMALALNCKTPKYMYFDRKNYYYPDLPKGYQITQSHNPVGTDGYLDIFVGEEVKRVFIHDIHLEEDTASLDHYDSYSLIDYNRAGVPLLETVTEPCMHSVEEALAFLESLRRIFRYTNVSEARTDMGQMRCDVNVSIAPKNSKELGTKVEMKNINSFNSVKEAIICEVNRQVKALENNEEILMETRRYDEASNTTIRMRDKVEGVDYKYYVEPNIPPYRITDTLINEVKQTIPELQFEKVNRYMNEYGLSFVDSTTLTKTVEVAKYFENVIKMGIEPKSAANFITTRILGIVNKMEININELSFKEVDLVELLEFVNKGTISSKQAKDVFNKCIEENKKPSVVIKENNMEQITNTDEILAVIKEVIDENIELAKSYDPERGRTVDFFVGQVMKKTRGKANPKAAMDLIKEELLKLING